MQSFLFKQIVDSIYAFLTRPFEVFGFETSFLGVFIALTVISLGVALFVKVFDF
jgi:type IV secretory pathway VirB3-like protein